MDVGRNGMAGMDRREVKGPRTTNDRKPTMKHKDCGFWKAGACKFGDLVQGPLTSWLCSVTPPSSKTSCSARPLFVISLFCPPPFFEAILFSETLFRYLLGH